MLAATTTAHLPTNRCSGMRGKKLFIILNHQVKEEKWQLGFNISALWVKRILCEPIPMRLLALV